MSLILEDSRRELVARSKQGEREKGDGKTRYEKRLKSRIASSNKLYNKIDMNQLFKNNILTFDIQVKGETDSYVVTLSFGGFLDALYDELQRSKSTKLELRHIIKALVIAFNSGDVYIHCSCPDFQYRFSYWCTVDNINSGRPELRPANETNPNNNLGPGCKHICLVLSNTGWIVKVASVINNYIKYIELHRNKLYADIIYPAIYKEKYKEPVQLDMFDDTLDSDEQTINRSNQQARAKGQFKQGNKYRYQNKPKIDQQRLDIDTDKTNTQEGDE